MIKVHIKERNYTPQNLYIFRAACTHARTHARARARAHTPLMALCPGLPGWASTRKVKPIWILLKQETVSGSGICWAICKSAPRSRQITTPVPHHLVFYRPDALPATQPTASKHWRHVQHVLVAITSAVWPVHELSNQCLGSLILQLVILVQLAFSGFMDQD